MKAIALALALFCASAHAHDSKFHFQLSQEKLELAPDDTQSVIQQSHEIVEGDESGTFWQRWAKAFDFKTRVLDGYRWSSSVDDAKYKNLALDSLYLFGLSHGTEMLAGPTLLAVGYAHNWPAWAMSLVASGGTMISIPGLDPLCLAAFAFFAKSETFRAGVGYLRLATVAGVKTAAEKLGLDRFFAKPDVREYLESLDGLVRVDVGDSADGTANGAADFTYAIGNRIEVVVHYENGTGYLERLTVGPDAYFDEMIAFTKQFGWNARQFIKHVMAGRPLDKPYVTTVAREGGRLSVELAPRAISISAKGIKDCRGRLDKKDL